jgi:co-chaperonin GroES (HSP10)
MSANRRVAIDYGKDGGTIYSVWEDNQLVRNDRLPDIRMHGDWLMVLLDPDPVEKVTTGGIHIPQTATDNILRTGTVVLKGPGKWAVKPWLKPNRAARDGTNEDGSPRMVVGPQYRRMPLGVEVGERVLFIKFAVSHTETSKRIQQIVGKDFGFLQPSDILLAGGDVVKVTG